MTLTIFSGTDKNGEKENFDEVRLNSGNLYAICGSTGAGKSQLIKDIEMLVNRDSVSKRKILINGEIPDRLNSSLIAHLGQNMRFVLDIAVEAFIKMHLECRQNKTVTVAQVLKLTNSMTNEKIKANDNLLALSGGQSRALMIADIALVCNSPIVLIDEIENAGVDKTKALSALVDKNKLVLIVTHNPHTILLAKTRIVLNNGAIKSVIERSENEVQISEKIATQIKYVNELREKLRGGEVL